MRQWPDVLLFLIIIRMADAITDRNGLHRFGLVHLGALIGLAVSVRGLLLMGRFEKWNDDIDDRQRFSETAGFALGMPMGLGRGVCAHRMNWPAHLAAVLQGR